MLFCLFGGVCDCGDRRRLVLHHSPRVSGFCGVAFEDGIGVGVRVGSCVVVCYDFVDVLCVCWRSCRCCGVSATASLLPSRSMLVFALEVGLLLLKLEARLLIFAIVEVGDCVSVMLLARLALLLCAFLRYCAGIVFFPF